METFEAILTRRSIRKYTDKKIESTILDKLVKAGMFAPSAMNYRPWHFMIIDKREILDALFEINTHAEMLKEAQAAIMICGDRNFEGNEGLLIQNCSAATQNILLQAHAEGLGAVWVGIYPFEALVKGVKSYFNLPKHILPISIAVLGYPAENPEPDERYEVNKLHTNGWQQ